MDVGTGRWEMSRRGSDWKSDLREPADTHKHSITTGMEPEVEFPCPLQIQ